MEQYIQCGDIAETRSNVTEYASIFQQRRFCYYIFNNTYLLGEDFYPSGGH